MKKIFTTALCLLAAYGFTAMADETISWESPFTPINGELYLIPEYVGDIYVVTDSKVDITEDTSDYGTFTNSIPFLFNNEWGGGITDGVYYNDGELYTTDGGNYVYGFTLQAEDTWGGNIKLNYGIKYEGETPVQFTVYQGKYTGGGGGTVPAKNIITEDELFTAGPAAPGWYYTPTADIPNYYYTSNSKTNLISNGTLAVYFDYGSSFETKLEFEAIQDDDGYYVYVNKSQMGGGNEYFFNYTGSDEVNFTLKLGEFVESQEIAWGVPFQAGPNYGQKFTYVFSENYSKPTYVQVNTSTDVLNNGTLVITNQSNMEVLNGWKVSSRFVQIEGPDGNYGYTGPLTATPGTILNIKYTGSQDITIAIGQGQYTENGVPTYMAAATYTPETISVNETSAGIDITWGGQNVTYIGADDTTLNIYYNDNIDPLTIECRDYLAFVNGDAGEPDTGLSTYAITNNESGTVLTLLLGGALNNAPEQGVYRIVLPEGLVKNDKGELNAEQTLTVTVVSPTIGTVSPVEGTEFEYGDDVTFTIAFDGTAVPNEAVEDPIYVTDYNDVDYGGYELRLNWSDDALYVNDEGQVVVNLGNGLASGTYFLSLLEGAVTINGAECEGISDFRFVVNASPEEPELNYLAVYPTVTPDPREDSVDPFTEIVVVWEGYTIQTNMPAPASATFNGNDLMGSVVNNTLVFPAIANESGTYTLLIPAEYIVATDEDGVEYYNQSLRYDFVVMGAEEPETIGDATANITVGEQGGITSVSITWADFDIARNEASDGLIGVTSIIEGEPVVTNVDIVGNALVITFADEFTADDSITVTVPEGYVFVGDGGAVNAEQTFNLTSTGVGLVGVDGELGKVYTIQGLRVKAQKASELPAGLYIIDGKKVVIRK